MAGLLVNFAHPANRKLIGYLLAHSPPDRPPEVDPDAAKDPYYTLGTHPDIVARLWDDFSSVLAPHDCRWILYGRPELVHPESGVVFGGAGGTLTYALRLPPHEHDAALGAGAQTVHHYPAYPALEVAASTLDLADFGPEWVFGGWFNGEELWCLAAFNDAGKA